MIVSLEAEAIFAPLTTYVKELQCQKYDQSTQEQSGI